MAAAITGCVTSRSFRKIRGRFLPILNDTFTKALTRVTKGACKFSSTSWIPPGGHETGVMVYNTASKSKVPLKTIYPGILGWYVCGPTVYDSAHIGHALCYVRLDIMRRILMNVFGIDVVMVMGITDIDDKIIARANELKISIKELTLGYEKEFFEDMSRLSVMQPTLAPRVTNHIGPIIEFIQGIINNGHGYVVEEGTVYFDVASYSRYGKLMTQSPSTYSQVLGKSLKRTMRDFVLWKAAKPGEPSWESPWCYGRPGWHIECSVMACQIFGQQLDLHSGGVDLIFPHHENEEAQCCSFHNSQQWCNYWLHTGHLHMKDSVKMSKSLRNTISISELLTDHSPDAFRLFCLLSHYRNHHEYSETSVQIASAHLRRIKEFLYKSNAYLKGQHVCQSPDEALLLQKLATTRHQVKMALADDFDTVKAMGAIMSLIAVSHKELQKTAKSEVQGLIRNHGAIAAVMSYIIRIMKTFGIKFTRLGEIPVQSSDSAPDLTQIMDSVVEFRQSVRKYALLQDEATQKVELTQEEKKVKRKDRASLLQACDQVRQDFGQAGLILKDYTHGSSWSFEPKQSESDQK
ncbi:putative cysteine--tRNA ligase, mitochondrial isoform X2 [Oratosquilla oratoria]